MRLDELAPQKELKPGAVGRVGNVTYKYDANKGWLMPNGKPAAGMAKNQLMLQYGRDPSGDPIAPSMLQKLGKKLGIGQGAPFGQGIDPKAGVLAKGMGTLGSMLGRAASKVASIGLNKSTDADGDGQPDAAPAQAQAQAAPQQQPAAPTGRFAGSGVNVPQGADSYEMSKNQMRKLQPAQGAKPLPAQMVTSLQADMKKLAAGDKESGVFAADKILKFAQAGYDVSKLHPQWMAHAKAGERMLTQSVYHEINNMLESFGLTWKDLGLIVRIDESVSDYVFIMSNEIADLKIKAGI
jgi:hypothetical protein